MLWVITKIKWFNNHEVPSTVVEQLLEVVIRKVPVSVGIMCREPVPNFGGFVQSQLRE